MSICLVYSFFLGIFSMLFFFFSLIFMILDYLIMIEYEIFSLNSILVVFSILLDWVSLLFMSFVFFISSMVIYYSNDYMMGDLKMSRFILLVFLFVFSMMLMIISPNLISILLGWDGLGLISYCLVVYYQNTKSFNSGMITVLMNRVGDVALLVSIAWMLNYGSWNFLFYVDFMKTDFYMFIISFLVCIAALTKSAQIPFSAWLPAAMAAPTPVSSLVHSSTLVTAGVYLLIRFHEALNINLMLMLLFISLMTMFMAGLSANFEFDLKKIIAFSTLSQLGLMMSILALGESLLAFFHLLMHALFKALLFMSAGSMIHNLCDCQDIRYMGSLINFMPLTSIFFNICNLALCGLPFLSGFYSKDLILEVMSINSLNFYVYIIFYLSTGLTVMYTIRLVYYTMVGDFNNYSFSLIEDSSTYMMKGMGGLIFMVIFGGSFMSWLMFPTPYFICLPLLMKMMILFIIMIGGLLGYMISILSISENLKVMMFYKMFLFSSTMWNLNYLSTFSVNYYFLYLGDKFIQLMDQGWLEYYGSQNLYFSIKKSTLNFQIIFNNNLKIFLILVLIWIFLMFF